MGPDEKLSCSLHGRVRTRRNLCRMPDTREWCCIPENPCLMPGQTKDSVHIRKPTAHPPSHDSRQPDRRKNPDEVKCAEHGRWRTKQNMRWSTSRKDWVCQS